MLRSRLVTHSHPRSPRPFLPGVQGRFIFGAGLAASCRTFRGAKGPAHVPRVPVSGWPLPVVLCHGKALDASHNVTKLPRITYESDILRASLGLKRKGDARHRDA